MTTSFSPVETKDGTTPIEMMFQPSGNRVCQSGERIGVSLDALAEVHGYLANPDLQDLLAVIAASPAATPNRAGGVLDPSDQSVMRIPLINAAGRYALIDVDDYPLIQRYRWRLDWHGRYAVCTCDKQQLRMHRQVMIVCGESDVDHKNRDGLDNRKGNLRVCSHAENMWNMKRSTRNTTGVKGVLAEGDQYLATVTARRVMTKKLFRDLTEAAAWVSSKRAELHGEFARHD